MELTARAARVALVSVAVLLGSALPAAAQCGPSTGGFSNWLRARLCELAAAAVPPDAQAEAPSATSGSTSLVEKGTAPDIFSLALGLAGIGANEGEDETATTMTVSAYAVRSSVTGANPVDPEIYQRYRNWRRWSFSAGRAEGEGTDTPGGRVFGVKFLPIDDRDVGDSANAERFRTLSAILAKQGMTVGSAFHQAATFIAQALTPPGTPPRRHSRRPTSVLPPTKRHSQSSVTASAPPSTSCSSNTRSRWRPCVPSSMRWSSASVARRSWPSSIRRSSAQRKPRTSTTSRWPTTSAWARGVRLS
ncbi:MAG: hypothetical protein GEU99_26520 [Luteitalea sp.]|nr:hypothetical protein [Luteitalea sp.]